MPIYLGGRGTIFSIDIIRRQDDHSCVQQCKVFVKIPMRSRQPQANSARNKKAQFLGFLLCVSLCLLPVAVAYRATGDRLLFNILASDSMYYIKIASNIAHSLVPSFNGVEPTNGFHPFWGFLVAFAFRAFAVTHQEQIYLLLLLSIVLVTLGYILLSRIFMAQLPRYWGLAAIALMFPGAYSVAVEPRTRWMSEPGILYELSPWSSMNGLETPLSLFLWSLFALIVTKRAEVQKLDELFPVSARICLAGIIMARLDDFFLLLAVAALPLMQGVPIFERVRNAIVIGFPSVVILLGYLAYNFTTVGVFLPTSGSMKLDNALEQNLQGAAMVLSGQDTFWWWYAAVRIVPILFVLVGALMICFFAWRLHLKGFKNVNASLLFVAGLYLLMKSIFLFIAVPIGNQGYWYYSVPVAIVNAIAAFLAVHARVETTSWGIVIAASSTALLLFRLPNEIYELSSAERVALVGNYSEVGFELWEHRVQIRKDLIDRYPNMKLVEPLDGMFSYILDVQAEPITGLASSPKTLEENRKLGFWTNAVSQGYTIVPAFGYAHLDNLPANVTIVDRFRPANSPVEFVKIESLQ